MSLFNFLSNSFNRFFVKKFTKTANQSSALPPLKAFILEPILTPSGIFSSGTFTVDHTGLVSIDYLFDGGSYQGELAIFSLNGMEGLTPGSHEFIQEAAHRALTDSILGHIVIADSVDGARFDVSSGENWNAGEYLGIKSFAMTPDSEFGIMLVPNGHVQQVFDNPALEGDLRPLFSMVTANPNDGFHVGQIADVTGNGSTFVMEDLRMDLGTDRDYNDMIFQVRGAIGKAALMKDEMQPYGPDWRLTDMGKALLDYIQPYEKSLLQPTYPLVSPEPPDSHQPLVGIIDSYGFSHNNPDLDYQHIIAGKDLVDHDPNPYVPVDQPDPGTHLAGIIQATQNNQIGINGINDNAPMWFGRASNSNWADSLTEFVNVTKDSHQTAVIQLNLDLTHLNIDGTVTTRYDLTPVELHALDYARQNHVIVVVPAGDDGSAVSGLGQASQQFDNVVTVGSAHRITDDPHVPIAQAYARTDYSNYGISLDIVADGGTIKDPITSTVGDSIGTMAGTAVAAAQVVGALSLLWANNPNLDYRQVIEILKNTATDLNTPGWDNQTGVGLLNPKAAVGFAPITPIEWYVDPPINTPIAPPGYRVYIVQPEDSLIGISKNELHSDDGWKEIIKPDGSNFTTKNETVQIGDVLYLPITDEVGNPNPTVKRPPPIPNKPPQVELSADQIVYYLDTANEKIHLSGSGIAYDPNSPDDLAKIKIWLQNPNGSEQLLSEITSFTVDSDGLLNFSYDIPPQTLSKGVYKLKAIAYDQAGLASDLSSESFAVIEPQPVKPPAGLSDPIKYAIDRVSNLEKYDSGELDGVDKWAVNLSPDLSPEDFVNKIKSLYQIDVTYLDKETHHIPGTFIFEFPPDVPPAKVAEILNSLPGVEFTYPLVSSKLIAPELINQLPPTVSQWHLNNIGQTGGTVGADADVLAAWDLSVPGNPTKKISGEGIVIAIVDDGVEITHPNLADNYNAALSYNFNGAWVAQDLNNLQLDQLWGTPTQSKLKAKWGYIPRTQGLRRMWGTPTQSKLKGKWSYSPAIRGLQPINSNLIQADDLVYEPGMHGTSVAGVALANGKNGISGLAPNAQFANLQLIAEPVTEQQIADALAYQRELIQIYSNSWKPEDSFSGPPASLFELENGTKIGRGGLGNIYVFAAGNEGWEGDNTNYSGYANSRHAITVAAIDHNGEQAWYSTPGASILISGYSSTNDENGNNVGIVTTDMTGAKGYSDTNVTGDFGGTSAATPLVSGAIALMLEANPNLTQRDVQRILVETARKTDPTDPEWFTNAAGYHVNYKYGFGAIDVTAAVKAAETWKTVAPEVAVSSAEIPIHAQIPNYDAALVPLNNPESAPPNPSYLSSTVTINQDINVEWAEVMFDATHPSRGDLKVTLISPDGTKSILAEPHYDPDTDYYKWVFTSNRNWGETSLGDWTLQVSDDVENEAPAGGSPLPVQTWNSWKLNLYGTAKSNVTITADDPNANEDGNTAQFVVTRSGGDLNKPLTVNYSVAGNAINGSDYSTLPGTITIPAGATSVTIPVIPKSDGEVEGDETVQINLIDAAGYNLDPVATATATITDNTLVSEYGPFVYTNPANGHLYILSQPDTWLGAESQAQALGGNLVAINDAAEQAWLNSVFSNQGTYWIGLTDSEIYGTTEGKYKWVNGDSVTYTNWAIGEPSNSVAPWKPEGEDFSEMYANGKWNDASSIDPSTVDSSRKSQYGIIEVDPANLAKPIVLIQASDAKAGEEGNAGQLIVTRIGDTTNPLTVNYSVAGDATNGVDYQALNGTITIPAGASLVTIPIVPIGDYQSENAEKIVVSLNANSSYQVSAQGTGTVEIANESPINFLYRQVLGRDADSGGFNYHTQLLQNGKSIEEIRWQMAHDTLFGEAKDQITLMYQTLLGRAPLTEEVSYWQDRLGVDTTLSQVREMLSSKVADSIGEFSNIQGQNSWLYGYYQGSLSSDNFQQMTEVKYGDWWVDNADYWTTLNKIGGHPNSVVGGITPVNQFPVRRWVSEVDGNINISGILAKTDTNFNVTSDGTIGHILVDGVEVWSQAISATDNVGVNYSINAAVQAGSVVDFVIDAKSNDHYDGTKFTATITTEPLTPQPTTSRIYTNPITGNQYFLTAPDTWLGAEEQAKAAGGNLVVINDATEQQWLNTTFGGGSRWIGLTDSPIYGATEGNYKWVNGQPVAYTNWWGIDNVLSTPEGEDFAEMGWGAEGKWNDMPSNQTWIRRGIAEIASPPTAKNLTMAQIYTEDTPLDLTNIVVTSPDGQATVTLTVPIGAGTLTTGTSGSVTSTYDAVTGKWTASGYVPDVNALLAGLQFIPAANYNSTFNITTEVATSVAAPLTGYLHLIGIPVNDAPTLSSVSMLTGAKDNTPFTITYDTLAAAANEADIDSSTIAFQIDSLLTGTLTKNGVAIVPGVTTVAPGESLVWTPAIAGENLAFTIRANDGQTVSSTSIPVKIDVIPTVTIAASDANATEGADSGAFTITRTGKTDKPLTVNYSVANESYRPAINGSDYNNLSGTITIPAGQSAVTIPLTPIDDNAAEWEEPVYMNLSADSGYLLGASTGAQVTIWDNETPEIYIGTYNPSYTFGWDGYTSESSNTTSLLVRRLGSLANDVTVNYALTGTATNGLDYSTLPGSILLAAGLHDTYIPFTAINDTLVESDETAILTLLPGANNTVGGEVTNPTVGTSFMPTLGMTSMTIGDNDSKLTANIVATDAIGSEYGDRAEFTISLTDANGNPATATVPLTLNYSIWGADNGGDYTNLPGTITIPVGSSSAKLVVNPINDELVEGTESVGVLLYANFGDNYAVGANEIATLNITDNDYAASYVEDTTLDLPDAIITDPDGNTSVTLTLSDLTAGKLTTGTSGAVTSSFNAATGKWTASGALADVNALLANLKFVPNANYNSDLSISIAITDNPLTTLPGTIKLTGIPVDDAPTATNLNSTQTYTEGVALDLTNIVVSDIDSNTLTATLVLSNPAGGVLTTGTSGSTTSTYNAATGVWQVSGAKADVNALLASVKFTPATNFNSNLTIATQVSDGVNSLAGAITLNGTPVNYAPTFAYTANQTYTEDTALRLTGLAVSDADPEDTITATLQLSNIAAGSLSTLTSGSATATFNATTGIWTVSGNAADVNVILANLYFIPASNFNSNLTISASVTDSHSTPINRTINLIGTAVNDAPTLSSISVLTGATEKLAYTIPYANLKAASDVQDVDSGVVKFLITAVNSGTLAKNGTAVVPGVTTLSTGESLVWTPANFGNAIPAFNVVATDGTANSATAVPVTVDVAENLNIQKVSIAATDASASESGDTGTVTISRTGITTNALTVNYSTSGTATNGSDYNTLSGSITIPAGSSSVSIPITAINDTDFEGDEYLNLNLQTSANYVLEGSTSATVSIADNDKPTVSIVASDANAAETLSTETANTGEFTITRTGTTANSLTLNYTVAGTATNGSDYNSLGSTIVIPAGASSVTIPIIPIDNFTLESTETVVLNLSTDTAYNLGTNNSATVNIADNDTSIYESNQTLATAYNLGTISSLQTINDSVSSLDTIDYYKFDVGSTGTVTLKIQNFSAGTTLKGELVTKNGPSSSTSLFTVSNSGTVNISSSAYAGGTNYIRIYQGSGDASYSFEISKTA